MLMSLQLLAALALSPSVGDLGLRPSGTPADTQAVLLAAISVGARDLFSPSATRAVAARAGKTPQWSPSLIARLAVAIDAKVVQASDVASCPSGPSSCKIAAGVELLDVGTPHFVGDTALVVVTVTRASDSVRSPISMRGREYVVVRRGTAWVVSGVRTESAS